MIYQQLFERAGADKIVQAGVIGTGHFATAIVTQSQVIAQLDVPVICDRNLDAARQAFQRAGLTEDDYAVCENRQAAMAAFEKGKRVIVADAMLLMELPVDVVVESTGVPEASALHAEAAISQGKHLVMVSKEADVSVGPILRHKAEQAGVVYTAVDGDQHGLLIALVQWARDLGLEILCAGKALDSEMVFDAASGMVSLSGREVYIDAADRQLFQPEGVTLTSADINQRRALLGDFGAIAGYDVVEMAIAANATGLNPDVETLHCPPLRIPEIPEALAPVEDGGILNGRGIIDSVRCLRSPFEAGLGGGVFVVVGCENGYSRHILLTKGLIGNRAGTAALIHRPYHLCGVETPISILVAGLLNMPTAPLKYRPSYDVVAEVVQDLKAGDRVGTDHSPALKALMRPAQTVAGTAQVPLHMANGNPLLRDVSVGEVLTADMIKRPADSALWRLREEQDRLFLA